MAAGYAMAMTGVRAAKARVKIDVAATTNGAAVTAMVPLLSQCPTPKPFNVRDGAANEVMAMAAPIGAATMARMPFRYRSRANPACVRAVEVSGCAAAVTDGAIAKHRHSRLRSRMQHQLLALRHNLKWSAFANRRPANGQSTARSNDHNEQRKAAVPGGVARPLNARDQRVSARMGNSVTVLRKSGPLAQASCLDRLVSNAGHII